MALLIDHCAAWPIATPWSIRRAIATAGDACAD
jgi:hypothetical protein